MSGAVVIVQADPPLLSPDKDRDLPGTAALDDEADRVLAHDRCPGERVGS